MNFHHNEFCVISVCFIGHNHYSSHGGVGFYACTCGPWLIL